MLKKINISISEIPLTIVWRVYEGIPLLEGIYRRTDTFLKDDLSPKFNPNQLDIIMKHIVRREAELSEKT